METIILNSCAKINIGLNILRKRTDGYHDLETIFYPVKLCDTISFRKSSNFKLTCNDTALQGLPNNLVKRAKEKLEQLTGIEINAEVHLSKYIPMGGGLGGGSSNAAVTLKGLSMLFNLNISEDEMYKAALELGSDVPFFLKFVPCFASSRGERMEEIGVKITQPILIVNPGIHVSTAWAFENITPAVPSFRLEEFIKKDLPVEEYKNYLTNDFEELVFSNYPEILALKNQMYKEGALFSMMSGSGSTVFGIYKNYEHALEAQRTINQNYLSFIHYEES